MKKQRKSRGHRMASQTKKIAFDTAVLFLGKIVGLLLGIVRLGYLTNYLGVEGFGILSFALYFCSLFQVLFDFGITQTTIREIARTPQKSRELVGSILLLKLAIIAGASAVVAGTTVVSKFEDATTTAVAFTTAALAINSVSAVFLAAFQAHRRMGLVSVTILAGDILLSASVIGLIGRFPSIETVLVLTLLVSAANLLILFALYTKHQGVPLVRTDIGLWKMLLRESGPIAASSVGISVYMFAGPTILKHVRGNDEVGIYSAGYKIVSVLTLIPASLSQVVYPVFSEFFVTAREKLKKGLADSLRVVLQISLPTAVVLAILAPDIIGFVYPESFSGAATVLQLIVAGNAFGFPAWILAAFLLATDNQRYSMWTSLATAATSVAANLFLIPKFGYLGVATVGMLTDVVLFLSLTAFTWKAGYSAFFERRFLWIGAASLALATTMVALKALSISLALVGGGAVYTVILLATGAIGDQEKELLGKLFRL